MFNKISPKAFSLIFIVMLTACSSEPNDYLSMIDEYETEIAKINAENTITFATKLAQQDTVDVKLMSFMDESIPTHYMNYHKGLGIDVTKLNYVDSDWMVDIKEDEKKIAQYELANPDIDMGHSR